MSPRSRTIIGDDGQIVPGVGTAAETAASEGQAAWAHMADSIKNAGAAVQDAAQDAPAPLPVPRVQASAQVSTAPASEPAQPKKFPIVLAASGVGLGLALIFRKRLARALT